MKARKSPRLLCTVCTFLFLAVLLVVGCGGAEPSPTPSPTPMPTPTGPAPAPAPEVFEWRMQQHVPPSDLSCSTHPIFLEAIEKNTNGRVKVTSYALDSIVPQKEMASALAAGTLDMISWDAGYSVGTMPLGGVETGLPVSYRSNGELLEIFWDYGLNDLLREEWAKQGAFHLTAYGASLDGYGLILNHPIKSLDELKGVKIRSFSNYMKLLEILEASPVSIPLGEMYTAAMTGAIDGALTAWMAIYDNKVYEACKYGVLPSFTGAGCQCFLINTDKWNELPDELKIIVELTARDYSSFMERHWSKRFGGRINMLKEAGVQFMTLSDADQAKLLQDGMQIWDEIAASDAAAAKGVQILKDYYKEVGRF